MEFGHSSSGFAMNLRFECDSICKYSCSCAQGGSNESDYNNNSKYCSGPAGS